MDDWEVLVHLGLEDGLSAQESALIAREVLILEAAAMDEDLLEGVYL